MCPINFSWSFPYKFCVIVQSKIFDIKYCCDSNGAVMHSSAYTGGYNYSDSMFAPIQWETSLQSNAVSHWLLAANIESALIIESPLLVNLLSSLQSRNDHSFKCYSIWNQHLQRRYRYDKPKPFVVNTNIKMNEQSKLKENILRWRWLYNWFRKFVSCEQNLLK